MTTEYATPDWTVLELAGVQDKINLAARRVAFTSGSQVHLDADDLAQEGALLVAQSPDIVRAYVERGDLGHLFVWLRSRLTNKAETETNRARRTLSRDRLLENVEDGSW